MADGYARMNQAQQEFALYDDLLKELAAASGGVPIGNTPAPSARAPVRTNNVRRNNEAQEQSDGTPPPRPARSPEYARVLDRYIARLVSLKRVRDGLALYRREIDRNPNDPGLYERLAAFLEQNKMGVEVDQLYPRARAQFSNRTWTPKPPPRSLRHHPTAPLPK